MKLLASVLFCVYFPQRNMSESNIYLQSLKFTRKYKKLPKYQKQNIPNQKYNQTLDFPGTVTNLASNIKQI